ncbi:transcriptional repressor LexA [Luteimonas sp. e5]
MDANDLTPRQQQVLAYIEEFIAEHGYAPTEREIADAFGLASKTGPRKHMAALAEAGRIRLVPGRNRSLTLAAPASGKDSLSLPILGRVAAGEPIGPAHEFDETLPLDPGLFRTRPDYLLRVRGDSMRDDGIFDGDLVAIRQADTAENGQTVVARIDGELTIKRLKVTRSGVRLLARNPDYAPIEVPRDADFAIEGLYCGLVRRD